MAILVKAFSYVPKGQFHPVVLKAGEKCPKEYEEIARKWGCFTPDADGAEAAKAELEAVKAKAEAARMELDVVKAELGAVKAELEAAKEEAETTKAELEVAKAELEAAKTAGKDGGKK
jgi:predicted  nucleic acid-binding Zn-ribbon protein